LVLEQPILLKTFYATIRVDENDLSDANSSQEKKYEKSGKRNLQINIEGLNLTPGIYHYTLQTDDFIVTKQMIKVD
jgi:hypothetical protein